MVKLAYLDGPEFKTEIDLIDAALTKLTEVADKLCSARPIAAKADRQHWGSRRISEPKPVKGFW